MGETSGAIVLQGSDATGNNTASVNAFHELFTQLGDASGNAIGVAGNPLRVDPTGTTTQPVSVKDQVTQTDKSGSGSIVALNGTVAATVNGCSSLTMSTTGTWVATVVLEATVDGTNWVIIESYSPTTTGIVNLFTSNLILVVNCGGYQQVRLRANAYTSGTIAVTWNGSIGVNAVQVYNLLANTLNSIVVGNIASAATDSGNPVKVGLRYNATVAAFSDGQRADLQGNQFGHAAVQFRNTFSRQTGNGTTTAKSGSGTLHGLIIGNNTTGGTITVYDNTTGSGTVIMAFQVGSPSGGLLTTTGLPIPTFIGPLGIEFATGLTAVRAGSANNDITLIYR